MEVILDHMYRISTAFLGPLFEFDTNLQNFNH